MSLDEERYQLAEKMLAEFKFEYMVKEYSHFSEIAPNVYEATVFFEDDYFEGSTKGSLTIEFFPDSTEIQSVDSVG